MTCQELGQRATTEVLHDLHLRVAPSETLADARVVGHALVARQRNESVEFGFVADRAGRGRLAALKTEQRHRDCPGGVRAQDQIGEVAGRSDRAQAQLHEAWLNEVLDALSNN